MIEPLELSRAEKFKLRQQVAMEAATKSLKLGWAKRVEERGLEQALKDNHGQNYQMTADDQVQYQAFQTEVQAIRQELQKQ